MQVNELRPSDPALSSLRSGSCQARPSGPR